MRVLQISNYYYPHVGGIEQTAHDFADSVSDFCEQKVFCFNHEKIDAEYDVNGVDVVRAGCFAKVMSQSLSFSYNKLLKKTFAGFNPDVVVFHYPNPFAATFLLKILKKRPECKLILYWHLDITKQKFLAPFFDGQTKKLLQRAVKVVATSPNYVDHSKFLPDYKQKTVIIPSCVGRDKHVLSGDVLARAEEIRHKYAGRILCFALGRHVKYKGIEYLVEAAKHTDRNVYYVIGGHGPLTDELVKKAEGNEKIKFAGVLSDDDVKAYFAACDIFCFPSIMKNEAFGLALAESMSYGKPSITFTIEGSGVNFVSLNGETGLEVENSNAEKYAEAINTLARDKDLRLKLGNGAKQRYYAQFTADIYRDHVLNLLSSLEDKKEQTSEAAAEKGGD